MDAHSDPYLNAASQAIQKNELDKARRILVRFLDYEPRNVEAWFLLSATAADPRAAARCLHNVLALDPHHDGATSMMTQLEQQAGTQPLQVMQVAASSAANGQICPYCSNPFVEKEQVVTCPKCQISHHYGCWVDNGHACAAALCDGFSIHEVYQQPLPLQPEESEPEMIVIHKEDIPDTALVTRKEQEQQFQRRLLLMALLAEEGQLPPDQARGLPSVDELLDQIQRDRVASGQPKTGLLPSGTGAAPPSPQAMPQSYQSSGVVIGALSIWPEQLQPTGSAVPEPDQSCRQCGYDLKGIKPRFCPKCGAEQQA